MSSAEAKVSDAVLQMVGLATRARRRKVAKLSSTELHSIHGALDDVRVYSQQLRHTIEERKVAAATGQQPAKVEIAAGPVLDPVAEERIDALSRDLAQTVFEVKGPEVNVQRLREAYEIEVKHAIKDVTADFTRTLLDSTLE